MAIRKALQLLLAESNPEDEQLICEALIEIDEGRHWKLWHSCELVHVDQLCAVTDCLRNAAFDAILIDLDLPGSDSMLEAFQRTHAAACGTAIIVLIDEQDEDLTNRLLREGAQDVLLKSQIECEPLARAIRYAVERQRRANALESIAVFDELTGLYNAQGFSTFAEHDLHLARRTGYCFTLAIFEIAGFPHHLSLKHRDDRDLLIIRASELLRTLFGETAVVARLGESRFGVLTMESSETGIERLAMAFESDLCSMWGNHTRFPLSVHAGSATYSPNRREDLEVATMNPASLNGIALEDLINHAQQRLAPKTAMLAT